MTPEQQQALERARKRVEARRQRPTELTQEQQQVLERARQRIAEQPPLWTRVRNRVNKIGRQGMAGIPGIRPLAEMYEGATGRQVLPTNNAQPQGLLEHGARFTGETLPWMAAAPAALMGRTVAGGTRLAFQNAKNLPGFRAGASRALEQMTRSYSGKPFTVGGAEIGGAFGAGAGEYLGEQTGIPGAQGVGTILGGFAGAAPFMAGDVVRNVTGKIGSDYFPNTEYGAKNIVAPQVQRPTGAKANQYARMIQDAPPGATPADATRDPVLRGLEQRAIQESERIGIVPRALQNNLPGDRPANLRHIIDDRRAVGRQTLQRELSDMYGPARDQGNRMISMIRYGAAPGAEDAIQPGPLHKMLDQAYETFRPAYNTFRGIPTTGKVVSMQSPDVDIPIPRAFNEITNNQNITASKQARNEVRRFLNNEWSRVRNRAQQGQMTTGDLIEVRRGVRDELRALSQQADTSAVDRRRLLSAAEDKLTQGLESSLSPDDLQALRATDAQYRRYKILETATWMGGDDPLSAENLSAAIKAANIPARYARGADMEMRELAKSWTDITSKLDDPVALRHLVSDMSPESRLPLKAELINNMVNRAGGSELTPDNQVIPSGTALKREIGRMDESIRALATNQTDYAEMRHRLNRIADGLEVLQQGSAEVPAELFTEGPAWVFEILPALAGAKLAANISSTVDIGMGGGFVLAQRIARRFVDQGSRFAMQRPRQLMVDMVLDKDLYTSMLMREGGSAKDIERAVRAINAWGLNAFADEQRIQQSNEDIQTLMQLMDGEQPQPE